MQYQFVALLLIPALSLALPIEIIAPPAVEIAPACRVAIAIHDVGVSTK